MSIYYSLELGGHLDPAFVRAQLGVDRDGPLANPAGAGDPALVAVRTRDPDAHDDRLYTDAYGFAPRLTAVVELDKFTSGMQAREAPAIHVIRRMIEGTSADLYVSFLGDYPVLARRQGRVTVDSRWAAERPWLPSLFPFTYNLGELVDPYAAAAA